MASNPSLRCYSNRLAIAPSGNLPALLPADASADRYMSCFQADVPDPMLIVAFEPAMTR
jgi:hypothetical protein